MKSAKLIFAAAVIFAAGLAGGVALTDLRYKARARTERTRPDLVSSPIWYRLEFLKRVHRELELSPEQRSRIEGFIGESQERFRALWEPVAPQVRAELESVRNRIRAELSPGQQEKFDRMMKERPRRLEGRDHRPGEGGGTNRTPRGPGGGANGPRVPPPGSDSQR